MFQRNQKEIYSMRTFLTILPTLGFIALLSTTASACVAGSECTPTASFGIEIDTGIAGLGSVAWQGDEGYGLVEKFGETGFDAVLSGDSDLCPDGCGDGTTSFQAYAREHVYTEGVAFSTTPGQVTTVYNEAATAGRISFGTFSMPSQ